MGHDSPIVSEVPVGRLKSGELVYVSPHAHVMGRFEGLLRRAVATCDSMFATDLSVDFTHGACKYRADLHFNGVEPYFEVERCALIG